MDENSGIILSLDMQNEKKALSLASVLSEFIDGIKIGYPLILNSGIQIIKKLSKIKPVIADLKVADIPNTNKLICESIFSHDAESIIIHGFPGSESVISCQNIAKKYNANIFVVVEMSHNTGDIYLDSRASESIAMEAKKIGLFGIVAPATRPERIKKFRSIIGENMKIISPGIGIQGGNSKSCFEAGTNWVIVGRSLYNSVNPLYEINNYIKK